MANPRPTRTGKNASSPRIDEIAVTREKERQAVEMVLTGATLDEIAAAVGYADKSGAWRAIHRSLDRHEVAAVSEMRALENARLDKIQTVLWPLALEGDLKAIDRLLRLFERRARLNGLDQPQQFIGAFDARTIPADPTERAAILIDLRDRLAERMAAGDN